MTFKEIQAPGGTFYLRCHVCRMRLGERYADNGDIAVCLSCKPSELPETTTEEIAQHA